ncbi:MAG: sugar transporter ATP-binding protein [Verrucomicrobia bacterium]|nr:sugar transporter ATP-binding protein [Verrucomicrobiota bacterium]
MNLPDSAAPPALELRGIDKRFGTVHANRGVSLSIARGTIHGLIGENGAGKSTLMNIVYGFQPADSGEIRVQGIPRVFGSPQDAIAAGIGMVHQHFMLVENFTVLENIVLGVEGRRLIAPGLARARSALAALARDYGLEVPLDALVSTLPVGLQQRVEILKALYRGAEILILDEPTAVLVPQEVEQLFRMLGRLAGQGKTVILVTHKLKEIMAVTSRVTVMRQGAVVAEVATRETTPRDLAEKMVGRAVLLRVEKTPATAGAELLAVRDLEVVDAFGVARVKGVSFSLHAGEIVGVAGVAGNGQSELLEALAGIRVPRRGEIRVAAAGGSPAGSDPRARRRLGLAHVPEDRLRMGVVAAFSAEHNAILGYHTLPEYNRGVLLDGDAVRGACERKMAGYDVRPANPRLPVSAFSGGNQQKLVMAREIESDPRVLLVGQPTRGVDIGAIEFIHRQLVGLRDAGKAVLLVSVELDEIIGLSDRILVMAGGEIIGELSPQEATEEKLGLMMAGVREMAEGGSRNPEGR